MRRGGAIRIRGSGPAAAPLPLDGLAPLAAFSAPRRLLTSYTGPLMRVQRTSDNAEQDIGYTEANLLDVDALASFCSGTTGLVTTLYDQSGNSYDLVQATSGDMPRIYVAGAVTSANGTDPSLLAYDATVNMPRSDAFGLSGGAAVTYGWVGRATTTGTSADAFDVGASGARASQRVSPDSTSQLSFRCGSGSRSMQTGDPTLDHYGVMRIPLNANVEDAEINFNGTDLTEVASSNPTEALNLGTDYALLGAGWVGYLTEWVVLPEFATGATLTALQAALAEVA